MLYGFSSLDDTLIIHSSLFVTFTVFIFLTVLTYRISLIGRRKIKWASFGLTILILASLYFMNSNKELVYSLWNITMAGYILLVGDAVFQIIQKKKALTLATQISTGILLIFLIVIIMFELGSPLFHYITEWLIIACSLLLIVNYFLKAKQA